MKEYYTVPEVSELLKIDVRGVQRYIRIGKLDAVRIGKAYRIPKESIEKLLPGVTQASIDKPDLYDVEGLIRALEDLSDDEIKQAASILSYLPDALPKAVHELRKLKEAYKELTKE